MADWQLVGETTFTPNTASVDVGSVVLDDGADTLWLRITDVTGEQPWPFSYGIVSWRSSAGRELGSTKAYSAQFGEVFRLGVGLSPSDRSGVLTFQPRGYNLAWINKGNPWTLRFEQQSGVTAGGGGGIGGGGGGVIAYRVVESGRDVPWVYVERGLANLKL